MILFKVFSSEKIDEIKLEDIDNDGYDEILSRTTFHQPGDNHERFIIYKLRKNALIELFKTRTFEEDTTGGSRSKVILNKNKDGDYEISVILESSYIIRGSDGKVFDNLKKKDKIKKYVWDNRKNKFVEQNAAADTDKPCR